MKYVLQVQSLFVKIILVSGIVISFIYNCHAQTPDSVFTVSDTTLSTTESDTTLDSIVTVHRQTVIKKQIVMNEQLEGVFSVPFLSFYASIAGLWNNTKQYNFIDSTTNSKISLKSINRFRLLFSNTLSRNWVYGVGLGLKNIRFNIDNNRTENSTNIVNESLVDTLDVYYVNVNGVDVPHYILDSSVVKKELITKNQLRSSSVTQLTYITIPMQIQHSRFLNDYFYIGFSALFEPGILCFKKGDIVTKNGLETISRETIRMVSYETVLGIKTGVLLTSKISLEAIVFYSLGLRSLSNYLPDSFIRNQVQTNFGFVYSLNKD